MKLVDLHTIRGKIVLESGLHIGAGDTEMHIGGTDNPVITHPHTREPYIPGSSLKGKVRSLLEMRSGFMAVTGGDVLGARHLKKIENKEEARAILKLFGMSGADSDEAGGIGPCRASFADCNLSDESRKLVAENNWPLVEVKSENSINRIKGTAQNPRFTERVPAGLKFDFTVSIKVMEGDGDLKGLLLQGLKLLELDALGGSGSRGYGRIRFEFEQEELNKEFAELSPLN